MKIKVFFFLTLIILTVSLGALTGILLNRHEPNMCSVTFVNGNDTLTIEIEEEKKLAAPTKPTRRDYRFLGWARGEDIWDFSVDTVKESMILFAKWEEAPTCTVTFNTNGGSNVETQYIPYGDKVNVPEKTKKPDFIFDAWYLGNDEWNFDLNRVEKSMTLDAHWNTALPIHPTNP